MDGPPSEGDRPRRASTPPSAAPRRERAIYGPATRASLYGPATRASLYSGPYPSTASISSRKRFNKPSTMRLRLAAS